MSGSFRRSRGRSADRQRGQALLEFALLLPFFLILILSIVDFGWALRSWITVTNSAREGARLAAVGATCDDIKQRAVDTSADLLTVGDVSVTNCQGEPGDDVSVTVSYDYSWITPLVPMLSTFMGGALPSTLTMTSTSDMRLE
jgi:Flp pilus assembly protein TadG